MIILASKSPRRIEILKNLGIDFKISVSNADESHPEGCHPADLVRLLSKRKAEAVFDGGDDIVLSADTVVSFEGKILEKPENEEKAAAMLGMLSGGCHRVYTGFTLKSKEKTVVDYSVTEVYFRELSQNEIEAYVKTGEPMDKAGGYGIQEKGCMLVDRIEGDYFTVVGLPVGKVLRVLRDEFGYDIMNL